MTPEAREIMDTIREAFDGHMVKIIQEAIETAKTPAAAVEFMLEWHRKVPERLRPADGYVYKGEKLPLRLESPADESFMLVRGNASKLSHNQRFDSNGAESWSKTWWIHGFDRADWTPTMRKKLNYFMEEVKGVPEYQMDPPGWFQSNFLITKSRIKSRYIPNERRIKWSDIAAVKLPRNVGAARGAHDRIPGSYDLYLNGDLKRGMPADDIDTDFPVFWYRKRQESWQRRSYNQFFQVAYPDGYTLVPLQDNRITKFCRVFPDAVRANDKIKELWDNERRNITDYQKLVLAHQRLDSDARHLKDPFLVDDPEIQEHILYLKEDTSTLRDLLAHYESIVGDVMELPSVLDPLRKYPLIFDRYGYRNPLRNDDEREHAIIYMNAAYADAQRKLAEAEAEMAQAEAAQTELDKTD